MLRITELCKKKGINQTELAEMIGLSRVGLAKAIGGNPTLGTLEKIASALDVEVWELFTESTDKCDFMAMVKDGDSFHFAKSISDLEKVVETIKGSR